MLDLAYHPASLILHSTLQEQQATSSSLYFVRITLSQRNHMASMASIHQEPLLTCHDKVPKG